MGEHMEDVVTSIEYGPVYHEALDVFAFTAHSTLSMCLRQIIATLR